MGLREGKNLDREEMIKGIWWEEQDQINQQSGVRMSTECRRVLMKHTCLDFGVRMEGTGE